MIEKRFTRDNTGCVLDNTRIVKAINVEQVVKLLNQLNDENEQLKSEIEKITKYKENWAFIADCSIQVMNEEEKLKEDYLRIATNELKKLQEENGQLKSAYGEIEDYLARLEEENEKLKQLNIPVNKIKDTIVDCQGRIIGVYYND